MLIRTDHRCILVDTGPNSSEAKVHSYLRKLKIKKIDLLVLTHPDEDHIGNADTIIKDFDVERICMPPVFADNLSYKLMINEADGKGLTPEYWTTGAETTEGQLSVKVLSPLSGDVSNINEGSLVLLLTFGETKLLLMGDAGIETEKILAALCGDEGLDCDLLKIGHHGSATATGNELLSMATPSFAVISCAKHNSFGHPSSEVLARLKSIGAEIYRTDVSGDLIFVTDGTELHVPG